MEHRTFQREGAAVAAAMALFAAAGSLTIQVFGPPPPAAPTWTVLVAGVAMMLATMTLVLFLVSQLAPGGWDPVPLGRLTRDGWLLALVLTLSPAAAWDTLARLGPVPLGLDWLPGWPLHVTSVFILGRVLRLWWSELRSLLVARTGETR